MKKHIPARSLHFRLPSVCTTYLTSIGRTLLRAIPIMQFVQTNPRNRLVFLVSLLPNGTLARLVFRDSCPSALPSPFPSSKLFHNFLPGHPACSPAQAKVTLPSPFLPKPSSSYFLRLDPSTISTLPSPSLQPSSPHKVCPTKSSPSTMSPFRFRSLPTNFSQSYFPQFRVRPRCPCFRLAPERNRPQAFSNDDALLFVHDVHGPLLAP